MSKLNKRLPQPKDIRFINSARNKGANRLTMPFGGVIPPGICYLGWKQTSFAYSYQPQYYVKARLTPSKQLATGSTTSKTKWKWVNPDWKGDPAKPDARNGGVTMDTKNRWYRYLSFANKSLLTKGTYDKLEIVVRVRSYNPKAKQHGTWVTGTIVINCVPTVSVHKLVALADGGLRAYLNTGGWKRGGSTLVLGSVLREGVALNRAQITAEVEAIGGEEAADYPFVDIPGSEFNEGFLPGDAVDFAGCYFRTCDGVDASIDGAVTVDAVSAVIDAPSVALERDEGTATLSATVSKADAADDWDAAEAWLVCDIGGKRVRFDPVQAEGEGDGARSYVFRPPLDCPVELHVGLANDLGGMFGGVYTASDMPELAPFASEGRYLFSYTDGTDAQPENGLFNGSRCAALDFETEHSVKAERDSETFNAFGRGRPMAVLGDCLTKSVTVKGSVDATQERAFQAAPHSHLSDWEDFQEQQGVTLMRMPHGKWMHALVNDISLEQEDEYGDAYAVSVSLVEVGV